MVTPEKKERIRHVFSLSRNDVLYLAIIFMLGITIFFSSSIIQPLKDIADRTLKNQKIAAVALKTSADQQDEILAKLDRIETLLGKHTNATTANTNTDTPLMEVGKIAGLGK